MNPSIAGEDGVCGIDVEPSFRKLLQKTNGEVTPEKVAEALRIYQSYVREYGTLDEVPLDLYVENILAIRPVLQGLSEAFADPKTGIGTDLMKINPDEVEESYYEIWNEIWDYVKMIIHRGSCSPGYQQCSTDQCKDPVRIYGKYHYDRDRIFGYRLAYGLNMECIWSRDLKKMERSGTL